MANFTRVTAPTRTTNTPDTIARNIGGISTTRVGSQVSTRVDDPGPSGTGVRTLQSVRGGRTRTKALIPWQRSSRGRMSRVDNSRFCNNNAGRMTSNCPSRAYGACPRCTKVVRGVCYSRVCAGVPLTGTTRHLLPSPSSYNHPHRFLSCNHPGIHNCTVGNGLRTSITACYGHRCGLNKFRCTHAGSGGLSSGISYSTSVRGGTVGNRFRTTLTRSTSTHVTYNMPTLTSRYARNGQTNRSNLQLNAPASPINLASLRINNPSNSVCTLRCLLRNPRIFSRVLLNTTSMTTVIPAFLGCLVLGDALLIGTRQGNGSSSVASSGCYRSVDLHYKFRICTNDYRTTISAISVTNRTHPICHII